MRRKVTIRTMALTPDGMGGNTSAPSDVTDIPARVEPLEGREQLQAMATGMVRPHRFTLRYQSGLSGAKQIVYDGRTFDIQSVVDPEEKHRELIVLADEVQA